LLGQMLEKLGHSIVSVDSGAAALQELSRGTFDLLVLDYHMPQMDGLELIHRIRSLGPTALREVPVLMVTADSASDTRDRLLRAGADFLLRKPLVIEDLAHALERLSRRAYKMA